MSLDRRGFVLGAAALSFAPAACAHQRGEQDMFGMIGRMVAVEGERDALIAILLENAGRMPGCLSYVVGRDAQDENVIWVTEVWESAERHQASLEIAAVRDAISRARPLIAGMEATAITAPAGGHGLVASSA